MTILSRPYAFLAYTRHFSPPPSLTTHPTTRLLSNRARADPTSPGNPTHSSSADVPKAPTVGAEESGLPKVGPDTQWQDISELAVLSGMPKEHIGRVAEVYLPAKTPSQQGPGSGQWQVDFGETRERWTSIPMGWTASADPLSTLDLKFPTKESALAFATRYGWKVNVRDEHSKTPKKKSYADNFAWNKRTRIGTK